jgi:predicted nucleic acid-binding protein
MTLLEAAAVELFAALTLKLGVDEGDARDHLAILRELAETVQPTPTSPPEPASGHPADDMILASAEAAEAGLLITGDRRHLLPLGTHRGLRILSPQAFLAELHQAT